MEAGIMSATLQVIGRTPRAPAWRAALGGGASPLDVLADSGVSISLPRDRELYAQGDRAEFCYRVVSGCLRTVRLMEDGRRQVGGFVFAGDCLGFDALDCYDFAAEAVTDVVVRRYRRREVDTMADRHAGLARALREMAARDLRDAYDRMLLLGRKTASERIATFLLEMAGRQGSGDTVALPMCRIDIADHLGLTVETVCRMITHLRREGTIAVGSNCIELLNLPALRQMAADPRH
jgi:CRP/FNR family transcriptional regulator, nitrogen fixation regulation protein